MIGCKVIVCALLICIYRANAQNRTNQAKKQLPVESKLTTPQLIMHWGYPSEVHRVKTADGYILVMHRIPWGRRGPDKSESAPRRAVFLQHGILQTSDQWVYRGPGKDLALFLSDMGFDVWMGNFRGNYYSRRHTSLSPRDRKFWDFSWDQNSLLDLPAMIDYACNVADVESVVYVGHSMGTTAILALLSMRPQYNARIRAAFLMAPVVYFDELHNLGTIVARMSIFRRVATARLLGQFVPRGSGSICNLQPLFFETCIAANKIIAGFSAAEYNSTVYKVVFEHFPAGSSLTQFWHYMQVIQTGEFKMYDYGKAGNLAHYNRAKPPKYNLKNVTAPIYLLYASGDQVASPSDVKRIAKEVSGPVKMYRVPQEDFSHMDYLYGSHTYELVYKYIIDAISSL